jgi:hypothetical protein
VRTLWDEYDSLLSSPFPCKATLKIPLQADPKTVEDGNAVEIIVFARANADALAPGSAQPEGQRLTFCWA